MLKYVGIILFSGAISMYGMHLSLGIKEDAAVRKALFELLVHIKNCIDNGGLPLDEIYKSFNSPVLDKYGFSDILKSNSERALSAAVNESGIRLYSEIKELYTDLGESLGKSSFRKSESDLLARFMSQISRKEEELSKKDGVRKELYRRLGVLGGLLAALLLV